MAYKSTEEIVDALRYYNDIIEDIPESFEVHNEYLIDGMTTDDFITGYKTYHDLIKTLNTEMIATPDKFRLIAADKKGILKPTCAIHYPYLWLFIALSRSGEVKKGILHVNGEEFLSYTKGKVLGSHDAYPKNIESLIFKLNEYGFEVVGYKQGEPVDFTIEYKANSYLLPTIKASTLSQYQAKSLVSDYACFNALMFKTAPKDIMFFTDTHTAKLMPPHLLNFVTTAISELGKIGYNIIGERHHRHDGGWLKFKAYQFYYDTNRIHAILDIIDFPKNENYLGTLPEKYITFITDNMKCKGCKKGGCKWMRAGELFGKKRAWCNSSNYTRLAGFPSDIADIPYVVDIIANIYARKK